MRRFNPSTADMPTAPVIPLDETTVTAPDRILRIKHVCEQTGLCRATIYRLESAGEFPARIQLSPHAVGWRQRELSAWLDARSPARAIPAAVVTERNATRRRYQLVSSK